jgi:hypothetical protein
MVLSRSLRVKNPPQTCHCLQVFARTPLRYSARMDISAADLWAGFIAYCGTREPTPELMLAFARSAAVRGNPAIIDMRVGTIMAILRTRLACNRHFESRQDAAVVTHETSLGQRARDLRSAHTLVHLPSEIVDSSND